MESLRIQYIEQFDYMTKICTDFGNIAVNGLMEEGVYSYKEILSRLSDIGCKQTESFLKHVIESMVSFSIEEIYDVFLQYVPADFYEFAVQTFASIHPKVMTDPVILYTYYQKASSNKEYLSDILLQYTGNTYQEVKEIPCLKEKIIQIGKAEFSFKNHAAYTHFPRLDSSFITLLSKEEAILYLKKYIGRNNLFQLLQHFSTEQLLDEDLLEIVSSYPHFIYVLLLNKQESLRNNINLWERNFGIHKGGFLQTTHFSEVRVTYRKEDFQFISSYSMEELKRKVLSSYFPLSILETYIWSNIPDEFKEDPHFQTWFMEYDPRAYEVFYDKMAVLPLKGRHHHLSKDGRILSSYILRHQASSINVSENSFRFLREMSKKERSLLLFTPLITPGHLKQFFVKYIDFGDIEMARGLLLYGEVNYFLEKVPNDIQCKLIDEYLKQQQNPYLLYNRIKYVLADDIPNNLLLALLEYPKYERDKKVFFHKMYRKHHPLLDDAAFVEEYILPYKSRIPFIGNKLRSDQNWVQKHLSYFPFLEKKYKDLLSYSKKEEGKMCIHPNVPSYYTFEEDVNKIREHLKFNQLIPNSLNNTPLENFECRFLTHGHLLQSMYEKYYPKYEEILLKKYPDGNFQGKDNFYEFLQFFVPKKDKSGNLKVQNLSILYKDRAITEMALTTFRDFINILDTEGASNIDAFFLYKRKQSLAFFNSIVNESFTGKSVETILVEKGLNKDTLLTDILSIKGLWGQEKKALLELLSRHHYQTTVGDILSILDEMDKRELTIDEILEEREFPKKVFYQIYQSAFESNPSLYFTIQEYLKQNQRRGFKKYVNCARVILSLSFSSMEAFREHFPTLDLEKMIQNIEPYYPSLSRALNEKWQALTEKKQTFTYKKDYV